MADLERLWPDVAALPTCWRQDAEFLREAGADKIARAYEHLADALEKTIRSDSSATVGLKRAAELSGYTADHLGRLISEGKLRNVGRAHAPMLSISDLPLKARTPENVVRPHVVHAAASTDVMHEIERDAIHSKLSHRGRR